MFAKRAIQPLVEEYSGGPLAGGERKLHNE